VIFRSSSGNFVTAGVTNGCVVYLDKKSAGILYYRVPLPVKVCVNATALTLDVPIPACPKTSGIEFCVTSYADQAENAHFSLCEHFDIDDGDLITDNDETDLYNRRQLRQLSVWSVLSDVWQSQMLEPDDPAWKKWESYVARFGAALKSVKLQFKDDSGTPVRTVRRGSVDLIIDGEGDKWPTQEFPDRDEMEAETDEDDDAAIRG
jgi:hypothetical protein